MVIVHLMASPFFGGPERQMLGLARAMAPSYRSVFLTFAERGLCKGLLDQVNRHGIEGIALKKNAPRMLAAVGEVAEHLRRVKADVLCCSGYKPDIIGLFAARRVGIPVVSVAHGWTAATWKVRLNETLDRLAMRWMDKVVCVSDAQAVKVRRAGIAAEKVEVIHNAVGPEAFAMPEPAYQQKLQAFFPKTFKLVVGAAGRLSPEKGFDQLVEAAAMLNRDDVGFIVFGDGPLKEKLRDQIAVTGLKDRFILAGFHEDATKYFAYFDVLALPSYTEGLPVVLLEAMAVGVPAVATSVGGIPEVIEDDGNGFLVPSGNASILAAKLSEMLAKNRIEMSTRAKATVEQRFSVTGQSRAYERLFDELVAVKTQQLGYLHSPCHS